MTKAKQEQSDIWKQFSFVTEPNGKERFPVLSKFKRFILSIPTSVWVDLGRKMHKSGTAVSQQYTFPS